MYIFVHLLDFLNKFPNGSDHTVIACYLGLYEQGEVEHINGVRPGFIEITYFRCYSAKKSLHLGRNMLRYMCEAHLVATCLRLEPILSTLPNLIIVG